MLPKPFSEISQSVFSRCLDRLIHEAKLRVKRKLGEAAIEFFP